MRFDKNNDFCKSVIRPAFPLALQYLAVYAVTLSDSLTVGRLGDSATSAVYVGNLVFSILVMLITGIESGMLIGTSRAFGEEDKEAVTSTANIGIAAALLVGLLFFVVAFFFPRTITSVFLRTGTHSDAASYLKLLSISFPIAAASGAANSALRSVESRSIGTIASLTAFILHLAFNVLLAFGKLWFAKLGIFGIAISAIISTSAELLILLVYLLFFDKKLGLSIKNIKRPKKNELKSFLRYTSPLLLSQLIWIANTAFSSYMISREKSDALTAGYAVASTLNALCYIPMNGLGAALGISIGKHIGEGKTEQIKKHTRLAQIAFITLGITVSATLLMTRGAFISLYGISDEAKQTATALTSVLAITLIGTHYGTSCFSGLMRGGGNASLILKNDSAFIFLSVIPATLIASHLDAPLPLIFFCLKADQILKCIPAAMIINRFGWIKRKLR